MSLGLCGSLRIAVISNLAISKHVGCVCPSVAISFQEKREEGKGAGGGEQREGLYAVVTFTHLCKLEVSSGLSELRRSCQIASGLDSHASS